MSIKVMSHVWENSKQKGTALLLLLALADMADENGDCYPSTERLAKKARVDVRSAQRTIKRLIEDGELIVFEKQGMPGHTGQKTNLYRIVLTTIEAALTIPVPQRGGKSVTTNPRTFVIRRKVVTKVSPPVFPQGVVETPPDPIDPSVKDQKQKEVVAPDPFFHPVFLEVTNDPTQRPVIAELTTPASSVPDDADFLIELFSDYFSDRFAPERKTVLASIVQYTFAEVRHAIEEAKATNKSGVVQWGYVDSILERRYQQKLDNQTTSTPHDRLLGMRFGYQAQSPADDMIHTHPLWQAYRSKWHECFGEDLPVPPLKVKQYADTARFLDNLRVTPEEIERLVEKKRQTRKTKYSFLYTPEDIGQLRAEDALRNEHRDPLLVAAVCKVWKVAAGDFVNGVLDILASLDAPPTADEITRFGAWYAAQPQFKSQAKPPSSADSLIKRVHEFRAQRMSNSSTSQQPAQIVPRSAPLSDADRAERDRIKRELLNQPEGATL